MGAAASQPVVSKTVVEENEKRSLARFSALSLAENTKPLSPHGTITARNLDTWEGTAQEVCAFGMLEYLQDADRRAQRALG